MILSDRDIRARLARGDLQIGPLANEPLQVQPASVDLRLGREFLVYHAARVSCLDPREPLGIAEAMDRVLIEGERAFVLHPGEFTLGTTEERVRMPDDLVGMVDGRSSVGRLAVVVHATAGLIDPGFEGQITLELSNIGSIPVKLYPGMRIAQIVLHQMTSPAEQPYGTARGSHYLNQSGPQPSRIRLDE
ncbi:MAG TPA: dCTP deaminase [Polyangiaceae bacterium]|jgi:dCTP deaminase|nr:dCTP deaminase [Polyangiaceae bacterium]